ncbi:MAG: hypothetical protein Q9220_001425 [cf. Caloplaca sp. 1 TL-2023]
MPSSPRTPTHHRKSSNNFDRAFSSLRSPQCSPAEKRSSKSFSIRSIPSTSSIKPPPSRDGSIAFSEINGSDEAIAEIDGLGNLADELAEAWDNDDLEAPLSAQKSFHRGVAVLSNGDHVHRGRPTFEVHSTKDTNEPEVSRDIPQDCRSLSPPKQYTLSRHRNQASNASDYDGSDYGDEWDLERVEGISASLEHRLAAIESLARRGIESNGSGVDTLARRMTESLRDLGSQAGVEMGASRLTTAHTAMALNLAHQARLVQTLSHHLISPFATPPDQEEIDGILSLLASTAHSLPSSELRAAAMLRGLHTSTVELAATLSTLADSLHMIRQTTSLASRKLKAAKEALDEFRTDDEAKNAGIQWVEQGNWDAKLRSRECGTICRDAVDGFRKVCDRWEKTLEEKAAGYQAVEMAAG